MSVIDPLARHLEHFVYGRVCALSDLLHPDRGGSTVPNELASALAESESRPDRR